MELDPDAWSAVGSTAAAVIAIVAATVAIWQAKVASAARDAARDQAQSARDAVEEARAARHYAERPRFDVGVSAPPNAKVPWTTVVMSDGPEVHVDISWERQLAVVEFDEEGNPFEDRRSDSGGYVTDMTVGGSCMLPWWKEGIPEDMIWMSAKIVIEATEPHGEHRSWRHVQSVGWEPT